MGCFMPHSLFDETVDTTCTWNHLQPLTFGGAHFTQNAKEAKNHSIMRLSVIAADVHTKKTANFLPNLANGNNNSFYLTNRKK